MSRLGSAEMEATVELVRQAREQGLELTGPDGLTEQFTKVMLETALNEEITEHLGHDKHEKSPNGRASNTRNGPTKKTMLTDASVLLRSICPGTGMARSIR